MIEFVTYVSTGISALGAIISIVQCKKTRNAAATVALTLAEIDNKKTANDLGKFLSELESFEVYARSFVTNERGISPQKYTQKLQKIMSSLNSFWSALKSDNQHKKRFNELYNNLKEIANSNIDESYYIKVLDVIREIVAECNESKTQNFYDIKR